MIRRYVVKVTLLVLLMSGNAIAEIIAMDNMQNVKDKFEELANQQSAEHILGVFDIDMVLTQPSNPAMQLPNMRKNKAFVKKLLSSLNTEEKNILLNLITKSSPSMLIENDTPKILKALSQQNIKLLALTASLTGALGDIKSVEIWRYNSLKSLGIDFEASFSQYNELFFSELSNKYGRAPAFYKGILCSNGEGNQINKGDVLLAFLHKVNYMPKTIIFVDDKLENLQDMEQALAKHAAKISYIGIQYKGAENYPSNDIAIDQFENEWQNLLMHTKEIYQKMYETQN